MNRLLALDIGNSRIKAGLFLDAKLQWVEYLAFTDNVQAYIAFWCDKYELKTLAYTNVHARPTARLFSQDRFPELRLFEVTALTPAPIHNAYLNPERLGADRFVASVGAHVLAQGQSTLVIDIGTAVTYDWTDPAGFFRGGAIAPGIDLRFRSLHQFTARLPLVRWDQDSELQILGQDTASCIRSGVIGGLIFEVQGMVASFRAKAGEKMVTFATGGGSRLIISQLSGIIQYFVPNLVLEGIYHIVEFNDKASARSEH